MLAPACFVLAANLSLPTLRPAQPTLPSHEQPRTYPHQPLRQHERFVEHGLQDDCADALDERVTEFEDSQDAQSTAGQQSRGAADALDELIRTGMSSAKASTPSFTTSLRQRHHHRRMGNRQPRRAPRHPKGQARWYCYSETVGNPIDPQARLGGFGAMVIKR